MMFQIENEDEPFNLFLLWKNAKEGNELFNHVFILYDVIGLQ